MHALDEKYEKVSEKGVKNAFEFTVESRGVFI